MIINHLSGLKIGDGRRGWHAWRGVTLLAVLCSVTLCSPLFGVEQLKAKRADEAPVIDGELSETIWQSAAAKPLSHVVGSEKKPSEPTEVKVWKRQLDFPVL